MSNVFFKMKLNGKWKAVLVIVLLNIFGYLVVNGVYRLLTPECFDEIEKAAKSNEQMMNKIGGYKSRYTEMEIEEYIKGEPAEFELRILGGQSRVIFTGVFQKINGNCRIVEIDTVYSDYKR